MKRRLQRLRAACEAMGVADSMLLPREQWVTEEEQGEIDRATAALDKEKRDDAEVGVEEGEGEEVAGGKGEEEGEGACFFVGSVGYGFFFYLWQH